MNTKFSMTIAGLALAMSMAAGGPVAAKSAIAGMTGNPAALQVAALTPLSMQFFCAQHRQECRGGGNAEVAMSGDLMTLLKQVNVHVNRAIRPKVDGADLWTLNPSEGDCEDYVLSKRSMLIRHGVSAGSLRIAYTHTRRGQPHAVLVVRTSQGDYVLDNLENSVKTLRASGYTIRTMSSPDPRAWTAG